MAKSVKVRLKSSLETHGIGCPSLEKCIANACRVLKIGSIENVLRVLHKSSVVVDEKQFQSLPPQALLIFETKSDAESEIDTLVDTLRRLTLNEITSEELLKRAGKMPADVQSSLIVAIAEGVAGNIKAESRDEDPDWFKGITNSSLKTKSRVMEESVKRRIRNYYSEAREFVKKTKLTPDQRQQATTVLENWKVKLDANNYNGFYFSRARAKKRTFCCGDGWFTCEGDYKSTRCRSLHRINPYRSRDERILFSTWNLDHRVEKARTILPRVIEMLRGEGQSYATSSWQYLYRMMFTRDNLKLVDIRCHDKRKHGDAILDEKRLEPQRE